MVVTLYYPAVMDNNSSAIVEIPVSFGHVTLNTLELCENMEHVRDVKGTVQHLTPELTFVIQKNKMPVGQVRISFQSQDNPVAAGKCVCVTPRNRYSVNDGIDDDCVEERIDAR